VNFWLQRANDSELWLSLAGNVNVLCYMPELRCLSTWNQCSCTLKPSHNQQPPHEHWTGFFDQQEGSFIVGHRKDINFLLFQGTHSCGLLGQRHRHGYSLGFKFNKQS